MDEINFHEQEGEEDMKSHVKYQFYLFYSIYNFLFKTQET